MTIPNNQYHPINCPRETRLKWITCNETPSNELVNLLKALPCVQRFLVWQDLEYILYRENVHLEILPVENVFLVHSLEETKNQLYKYALESKLRMFDQNKKEYESICWYMRNLSFIPFVGFFYRKRYLELASIKNQIEIEAITYAKYISEQFKEMTVAINENNILFYLIG